MAGYRTHSALTQRAALFRWIAHFASGCRLVFAALCGLLGAAVLAVAGAEPVNAVAIGIPAGAVTFLLVTY